MVKSRRASARAKVLVLTGLMMAVGQAATGSSSASTPGVNGTAVARFQAGAGNVGDGGPAINAYFSDNARVIGEGGDGSAYISHGFYLGAPLRHVALDGTISTVTIAAPDSQVYKVQPDRAGNTYLSTTTALYKATGGSPAEVTGVPQSANLASDAAGNLFFTDQLPGSSCTVIKRLPVGGGAATTVLGSAGCGVTDATADGSNTPSTTVNTQHFAVDDAGNVFYSTDCRVRKLAVGTNVTTTVGGQGCPGGQFTDLADGSATAGPLQFPQLLAVSGNGALLTVRSGSATFRRISGGNLSTVATGANIFALPEVALDGTLRVDGTVYPAAGPSWTANLATGEFATLGEVTGKVYATLFNEVRTVASNGTRTVFAGTAPAIEGVSAATLTLADPSNIAVDGSGNLYLGGGTSPRIRKITPAGAASTAYFDSAIGGKSSLEARPDGRLVFVSEGALVERSLGGTITTLAPINGEVAVTDNTTAFVGRSTTVSLGGGLFRNDNVLTEVTGPGQYVDVPVPNGSGGLSALASDGLGNLYTGLYESAPSSTRVQIDRRLPAGQYTNVLNKTIVDVNNDMPRAFAVDNAGNVFVGLNRYGTDGSVTPLVVPDTAGKVLDLVLDKDGNLFVSTDASLTDQATVYKFAAIGVMDATPPEPIDRPVAVNPDRILDSRPDTRLNYDGDKPGVGATVSVQVLGRGGVPPTGVAGVMLNVTATEATAPGFVTVWPSSVERPLASNLNLVQAGQTVAGLVTVPVGADGKVNLFTQNGTHFVVDVAAWYPIGDSFRPVNPARIFDTRPDSAVNYSGPRPAAGSTVAVKVAGQGGVPSTGVSAVVLTVTGTNAGGPGFVTVWPSGLGQPLASNLNFRFINHTIANQVIVPVGADGDVEVYTHTGADIIIDVNGYFGPAAGFHALTPARILDTRSDSAVNYSGPKPAAGDAVTFQILGEGGVPASGVDAVVVNVTATDSSGAGYISMWPSGSEPRTSSILNLTDSKQTVPNLAIVPVGADGKAVLYTQNGANLIVDVAGWIG